MFVKRLRVPIAGGCVDGCAAFVRRGPPVRPGVGRKKKSVRPRVPAWPAESTAEASRLKREVMHSKSFTVEHAAKEGTGRWSYNRGREDPTQ
jgi:hypothetical protein